MFIIRVVGSRYLSTILNQRVSKTGNNAQALSEQSINYLVVHS